MFNGDLTDKAIVMHFRIGTKGENDKATTHPFPISSKFEDLRRTYFEIDIAMVHNGVMRYYVSAFKELNKKFYLNKKVMEIISDRANMNTNKLCFKPKNIDYAYSLN